MKMLDFNDASVLVKEYREAHDLSNKEFGNLIGCTHSTVEDWISKENNPSFKWWGKILNLVGYDIYFLDEKVELSELTKKVYRYIKDNKMSPRDTAMNLGLDAQFFTNANRVGSTNMLSLQYACDELGLKLEFRRAE